MTPNYWLLIFLDLVFAVWAWVDFDRGKPGFAVLDILFIIGSLVMLWFTTFRHGRKQGE